ncbi:MAG: hypothetical protein GEV08_13735 [Acidimicrobiia bacterium]|nr:hypothetical protein [Acidimicrobiia bacterium]
MRGATASRRHGTGPAPRPLEALAGRLLAPAPADRLAVLRALVCAFGALYLVGRFPHVVDSAALPAHRWDPVGVLRLFDAPPPAPLLIGVASAGPLLGLAAALGWRWRATGPAFALVALVLLTYVNSWGQVLHTEHLLVLHLLVLAAAPAADAWAWPARPGPRPAPAGRYGFPVRLVTLLTVLTYLLAGWAKLRTSGWAWAGGEVLRHQVAHDNLRKAVLGSPWSPVGGALVAYGWPWRPLALATLLVELGAPVVLVWRRLRPWWAGAAWGFHAGVLVVMAVFFPYPLSGVAFASLFPLEHGAARLRRVARAARPGRPR